MCDEISNDLNESTTKDDRRMSNASASDLNLKSIGVNKKDRRMSTVSILSHSPSHGSQDLSSTPRSVNTLLWRIINIKNDQYL